MSAHGGHGPGGGGEGPSDGPGIILWRGASSREIAHAELRRLAVGVPADVARFAGQQVVFLEDLLAGEDCGAGVRCRGGQGEAVAIASDAIAGYCLLSTNLPSWKLVPAGRDRLAEITVPRFVLRGITAIELDQVPATESTGLSDEVFTHLSDALREPRRVRFLSLTSAGLESLPTAVLEMSNLESLNLGKNSISVLPPEIGQLTHLRVLKLSRNQLRTLPEEIGRLKDLEELHVSRNELESLPARLWNLPRLRFLNLGHNRLRDVPAAIADLPALREVELESNKIPRRERARIQAMIPAVEIEW